MNVEPRLMTEGERTLLDEGERLLALDSCVVRTRSRGGDTHDARPVFIFFGQVLAHIKALETEIAALKQKEDD